MRTPALPLLALMLAPLSSAAEPEAVRTDHLSSRLVAERSAVAPGQPLRLGLLLEHDPHWHTYWRNPGDSGLPTRIMLELPAGVTATDIDWPAPKRFELEEIVNFGYDGQVLLPLTLQVPAGFDAATLEVRARADWLICEEVCVPGSGEYRLSLPVAGAADPDPRWREAFEYSDSRRPRPLPAAARYRVEDERVHFDIARDGLPADIAAWTLFVASPQVVANGALPTWSRRDDGLRATLPRSAFFTTAPAALELVLVKDDRALRLDARHADATASE